MRTNETLVYFPGTKGIHFAGLLIPTEVARGSGMKSPTIPI
jgi:hypothetical protein